MATFIDRLAPAQGSLFPTEAVIEAVLVHDIPGRLRLVAPALKNKPGRAAMLRARLTSLAAVHSIHFNAMTGSVIVEYDAGTGARKAVLRTLDHAGYRLMRRRSEVSTPTGATELPAARAVLTAAFHCVLNTAVENAVMAVI